LNARRQLIHSRQALAIATVSLVRALGGGWTAPAGAGRQAARDAVQTDAQ
jgi:multidrug efflux system outer membrane protein